MVSALLVAVCASGRAVAQSPRSGQGIEELGQAHHFISPVLLEELSELWWDLEDETLKGWRMNAAANVVWATVHNDDGWYQVFGPAISAQFGFVGRRAKRRSVLRERLTLLDTQHTERLKLLLGQECTRTRNELEVLEKKLAHAGAELLKVNGTPRDVPVHMFAGHESPFVPACVAPAPSTTKNHAKQQPDPKQEPDSEQGKSPQLDAAETTSRRTFLAELERDLIDRLEATRRDFDFLLTTDKQAGVAYKRVHSAIEEANAASSRFFIEGFMGYAFQIGKHGVGRDLAGLSAGLGGGWGPLSIGCVLAEPNALGPYISISGAIFD
jgi:hypothetical protein